MNRRNFIWTLSVGSAVVFIPMYGCQDKLTDIEFLAIPVSMLNVSSVDIVEKLGELYKKSVPEESEYEVLVRLLKSKDSDSKIGDIKGEKAIQKMLKQKITTDFENDNIVVLDGWILSKTEARQCALFSLIS